jgi:hypothetical protein
MAPKGPVYTKEIPGSLYSAPSTHPIHGTEFRFGPGIIFDVFGAIKWQEHAPPQSRRGRRTSPSKGHRCSLARITLFHTRHLLIGLIRGQGLGQEPAPPQSRRGRRARSAAPGVTSPAGEGGGSALD